jgi:UDP-arabinose 4-epimerase
MRVLVAGGAGYIGSHTAKILRRSGFDPIVFDNFCTGHRSAVRWGPVVEGDLADAALIRSAVKHYKIKAVIHFAASAYVDESIRNPRKYFRNNVTNTLNLLDAAVDAGVNYLVFSSTCATYGLPERLPIPEDHPQRPVSAYGESKLCVERALHWYGAAYGLNWTSLRYFNAAGADPDGESGEDHDPETHLIPLAISAALGKTPALNVFGIDYSTPDGTAVRDYVHVTDLAEAHSLALAYLLEGGKSGGVNLGTGSGHSVREVIAAVERVSGRRVPTRQAPRRPGDPPILVADAMTAHRLFGWQPRFLDLNVIVETAWTWHTSRATVTDIPPCAEKRQIGALVD